MEDLRARHKELFSTIDNDGNGTVSLDEVCEAFYKLGSASPMEEALDALAAFGERVTAVTFEEFHRRMCSGSEPFRLGVLMIFMYYDTDHNGVITLEELKVLGQAMGAQNEEEDISKGIEATNHRIKGGIDFETFFRKTMQSYS